LVVDREWLSVEMKKYPVYKSESRLPEVTKITEAPLGEVANVDCEKIALAQRIIKFRVQKDVLNTYFVKYVMMSSFFQNQIQPEATGSTAQGIKASKLHKLKVFRTSLKEQKEIVEYIRIKCREVKQAIAQAEKEIELIQEYRTTLISDAVTGKIDIRDTLERGVAVVAGGV
jgi:type I restriction enzyme S subunit